MIPSNPTNCFVSSNDLESFTYTPGASPYYAVARKPGYVLFSLMVFADSEDHVKEILHDMVEFFKKCNARYEKAAYSSIDAHARGRVSNEARKIKWLEDALSGHGVYELKIAPTPINQLYKIGWADNDTIL